MKRNKIPHLWNIPLFDYHLKWNTSHKDLEKIENEEISIVGYIAKISVTSAVVVFSSYFLVSNYISSNIVKLFLGGLFSSFLLIGFLYFSERNGVVEILKQFFQKAKSGT